MWTIDRLSGMIRTKAVLEEMIEDADYLDSVLATGEEPETSGDLETEEIGWTNWVACPECYPHLAAQTTEDHLLLCDRHKQSSHPTPPTPSTPGDAPAESATLWMKALQSLLDAEHLLPPLSETSSTPLETGDSEISGSRGIYSRTQSPPSSTTTSTPKKESGGMFVDCVMLVTQCYSDNCRAHSLESLGLTRACECESRNWVYSAHEGPVVCCNNNECSWLEGYVWMEDTGEDWKLYKEWLDERT